MDTVIKERARRASPVPPEPYPAEKARQGTIVLRKPWQRGVFFAGLFGGIVLVLALGLLLAVTA